MTGLRQPTAVSWAPDGRMFVAEKEGRVRVVMPDGRLRPTPLLDISEHVNAYWDRGLTDVAVAPDFAQSGRLYLLYDADRDPVDPEGPKAARLTHVTVLPDGTVADSHDPETVVLGGTGATCPGSLRPTSDCLPVDWPVHGTGTVIPAADGTLWVGLGDGKESGQVDDPLTFRPFDPDQPSGKILHVDENGLGLPGHPFCPGVADLTRICTKVFASGLRNPFRFAEMPGRALLIGDVGWNLTEEISVAHGGENLGWPCYEGGQRTPVYQDLDGCATAYAAGGFTAPAYTYGREQGASVLAGPIYGPGPWPDAFDGQAFVADTVSGRMATMRPGRSGVTPAPFATGLSFPVDLALTPGGELAYVAFAGGRCPCDPLVAGQCDADGARCRIGPLRPYPPRRRVLCSRVC